MNINDFFGNSSSGNGNNTNNGNMNSCELKTPETAFPEDAPVGMAYVPFQKWEYVYEPQVAIDRGTIFEALDKPFIGERAV